MYKSLFLNIIIDFFIFYFLLPFQKEESNTRVAEDAGALHIPGAAVRASILGIAAHHA